MSHPMPANAASSRAQPRSTNGSEEQLQHEIALRRLYYQDAYRASFSSNVAASRTIDGRVAVALDRTAFYPTGGGQPHDTGSLNDLPVVDVVTVADEVWHLLDGPLDSPTARGQIDWQRRWDHMQNHSGQHILSQAFIETAGALTVGWHLSPNSVTIDLDQAVLSDEALADAESLANHVVDQNLPITARFVSEAELATLSLRKQPDVEGPLRIVEIGDFDRVACSGTHVSSSAQVGTIKVLRSERRGQETRIHFACGQRALADYQRKHQLVRALATSLSCGEDELADGLARLQEQSSANYKALRAAQAALVEAEAARLWSAVEAVDAPRIVSGIYRQWDSDQIKQLALDLGRRDGCFAALAGGVTPMLFVASHEASGIDAGAALRAAVATVGGKGGGRPNYAQGAAPDWDAAEQALRLLNAAASASRSLATEEH